MEPSASAFLIILFLLHFLEPEFDPSWRLISEYELGNYGWLMRVAFFSMAVGSISLFITLRSQYEVKVALSGWSYYSLSR
jgi:Protein of unknown function (DUF998)